MYHKNCYNSHGWLCVCLSGGLDGGGMEVISVLKTSVLNHMCYQLICSICVCVYVWLCYCVLEANFHRNYFLRRRTCFSYSFFFIKKWHTDIFLSFHPPLTLLLYSPNITNSAPMGQKFSDHTIKCCWHK